MRPSNRFGIVVPLVSAISLVALSAHAQDVHQRQRPAAGSAPHANRPVAPVPHYGAPQGGQAHVNRGGPPPQGRFMARGPMPSRMYAGHVYRGHLPWEGGQWRHEVHNGRNGWWWDVGGVWYYYPEPMAGPPTYISEDYVDEAPEDYVDGVPEEDDAPPAAAYAPPPPAYAPPPPPPADTGASAVGGAIVGGVLGGLLTGRASGAAAGAVVGGVTGAIAASRPGYYWAQGNCYYRYPNGQYALTDPGACY